MTPNWKPGRGLLGPLKPLLGAWRAEAEMNGHRMVCTRTFEPFGKGWVRLALPPPRWVSLGKVSTASRWAFLGRSSKLGSSNKH